MPCATMLTGDHMERRGVLTGIGITQEIRADGRGPPSKPASPWRARIRRVVVRFRISATLRFPRIRVIDPVEADALSEARTPSTARSNRTEDFIEGRRAEAEGRCRPRYQGK